RRRARRVHDRPERFPGGDCRRARASRDPAHRASCARRCVAPSGCTGSRDRPLTGGSHAMTRLRANIVPLAVAGVLVVLALVFHARLIAWFRGDPTGSFSAPVTASAGGWKIGTAVEPDPPQQK